MLLKLLFVLPLFVALASAQQGKFPILPDTFATRAEVTHAESKRTFLIDEVFVREQGPPGPTFENSRISITNNGSKHTYVTSVTKNVSFSVDHKNRKCHAHNITAGRVHAQVGPTGKYHLPSAADLFKFGKKYNYTYVGEGMARKISCHRYRSQQTRMVNGIQVNEQHNWYFADQSTWATPFGSAGNYSIPVRVETSITAIRPTPSHTDINHVFDFIGFSPGFQHIKNSAFNLPDGIPCENLPVHLKLPLPPLPRQFSFNARLIHDHDDGLSYSERFAYDADRRETSVERNFMELPGLNGHNVFHGKHRIIHNFREGTQYNITNFTCVTEPLTSVARTKMFHDISLLNAHAELALGSDIFRLDKVNATHQPLQVTSDGVYLNVWIVYRNDIPLVRDAPQNQPSFWEYYFAGTSFYVDEEGHEFPSRFVPHKIEGHSLIPGAEDLHFRMMIDGFETGPPSVDFFDDSACFTKEQQSTEQFTMDIDFDHARKLEDSMIDKLASVMDVTYDRFRVAFYPGPGNDLVVVVQIHDVPTKGNPAFLKLLTTRKDATEKLRKEISKGDFEVSGNGVTAKAKRRSHSSSSQSDKEYVLNTGEAVGLSLGVLFLGGIVGVSVLYLWQKRAAGSMPTYKQDI